MAKKKHKTHTKHMIIIKILLALLGALIFLLFIHPRAQYTLGTKDVAPVVLSYQKQEQELLRDKLLQDFGTAKTFIPEYELASLVALSHYPKLAYVPIEFRESRGFRSAAARVDALSLIIPWKPHVYVVYISSADTSDFSGMNLSEMSFNNQVAVIAHELGHISEYTNKTSLHIANIALRYMFDPAFVRKFEHLAERRVLENNLGYVHLDWVSNRQEHAHPGTKLHKLLGDVYYSPDQTQAYIGAHPEQYNLK